jgi:hypothetical protein
MFLSTKQGGTMNRRDVMFLWGASSAFPVVAVQALAPDAQRAAAAQPTDELRYQLTYAFDNAIEDFVFLGIYTKLSDAEAHAERLKAQNPDDQSQSRRFRCIGVMPDQPHDYLVRMLTQQRLAGLGEALERVELALKARTVTPIENHFHQVMPSSDEILAHLSKPQFTA